MRQCKYSSCANAAQNCVTMIEYVHVTTDHDLSVLHKEVRSAAVADATGSINSARRPPIFEGSARLRP